MNNSPRLGYVIIYVQNVLNTVSFYSQAFGLEKRFIHESHQYAEMETGHTALAFADETMIQSSHSFSINRKEKTPAGIEIALVVEDVPAAFNKALEQGATKICAPQKKPWGQTVAYVYDINGCIVEICDEIKT